MAIPILIAARNEAAHLAKTLDTLPREAEPIVIPNGCTDDTAAIAEHYGAKVLANSPEGKLPALQHAVKYLGQRSVEPFITLDADSRPLFPTKWIGSMLAGRQRLEAKGAAIVIGPYFFNGPSLAGAAWQNVGYWRHFYKTRHDTGHGACGRNMLLDLRNKTNVHHVLALPHYWPREDAAIKDRLLLAGADLIKLTSPTAAVATTGDRFPSLWTRLTKGKELSGQMIRESYLNEAAPGSRPYVELNPQPVINSPNNVNPPRAR